MLRRVQPNTYCDRKVGRTATEIWGVCWVNVLLSNLKPSIGGAYHAFKQHKYAQGYLIEAAYRFNRRFLPRRLRASGTRGRARLCLASGPKVVILRLFHELSGGERC